MKTYDQPTYTAAREVWADGNFGPEWREAYRIAAANGYIYPPTGTRWDDVEEAPSQLAIVHQAIEDYLVELGRIMARSHSWTEVVHQVIAYRGVLRDQADLHEADAEWEKAKLPTRRTAPETIRDVLRRLWRTAP